MTSLETGRGTEIPNDPNVVVEDSRREREALAAEVGGVVTKDVSGKPDGGVVIHTLDLPSGELTTERFESEADYQEYIEAQLTEGEKTAYKQMNEEFEKVGEAVQESLERYLKADPYFAFQMELFKEGRLPENQIPVVQGVLYSLTEGHPGVKAFGAKYEGITDKLTNVLKAAPPKLLAGLKDLFAEKDSLPKWIASLAVALPIATIVGLETKGDTLKARLVDTSYARNTLIWLTYISRFLITDFGGTTGGELLGKGFKGYGNFVAKAFETGEKFFTAQGLSNPENWKHQWKEIGMVGTVAGGMTGLVHPAIGMGVTAFLPNKTSPKEENLQYIESNRYLAVRMKAYPGQIKALIQKHLAGTSLTEEEVALAAKFRLQAVHTGIANMDKSLLDQDFFTPPRPITQADVLQAYTSAAVKDLDRLLADNPTYTQAKERQDAKELTPEELQSIQGLDPINWVRFVYSSKEEQALQQESIENIFIEVLDRYKLDAETTGYQAFTPKGGSIALDSDSFIDKPRKRTLAGLLLGGWLAATILANTLSIGRNIVRKIYTGYSEGQDAKTQAKETAAVAQRNRRETALKHLYPEKVVAKDEGIFFEVKEFVKNPEQSSDKEKVKKVRYPLEADYKNGWGKNQSAEVLDFLRKAPNIREKHLNDIIKVFVGWGLITSKKKDEQRTDFFNRLNNAQTEDRDYKKEWVKRWEKPSYESEKIDISGKKFTFDFRKGPQSVIDEVRKAFKGSPETLKTYFSVDANKTQFIDKILTPAKDWSLHPDVLEAMYESTTSKVWNRGKSATYFMAGYTPVVPFVINHNPLPGGGKAREAYNNVGYGKKPWFDIKDEDFVKDLTALRQET